MPKLALSFCGLGRAARTGDDGAPREAALSLRFFVAGDPKGAGVQFANVSTETGMGFILRNCAGLVIEGTLTAPDAPWLEAVALVVYSPGEVTVSYKDCGRGAPTPRVGRGLGRSSAPRPPRITNSAACARARLRPSLSRGRR